MQYFNETMKPYFAYFFTVTSYILTLAILYVGWVLSGERYFIPDSGVGYWLGILGASMMLLLLVYPVRKRQPRWRYMGSVKFWFRLHMFLGVAGPVLIVWHSGYQLGSLNGAVAFFSMLIVASSGLVGRYLYRRIHHGLYGKKVSFAELYPKEPLVESMLDKPHAELVDALIQISEAVLDHQSLNNRSLGFFMTTKKKLKALKRAIKKQGLSKQDEQHLLRRVESLMSICRLGVNEIFFSYWHVLHLPLFIILIFSGVTHIAVVHFY